MATTAESKPVRITLFNHKGGVGKTTLTANIAFALAEKGKSVLLVDSDPQCNLTSYLLDDEMVDDLLTKSNESDGRTIWTAVRPIFERMGPAKLVEPLTVGALKLLPGDIKLSDFEEILYESWTDSFKRRLGALQAVAAISTVVAQIHRQSPLDYVFYDTGPNIGALNRVLLLDSGYFIVPVACDLYSVRALSSLGEALSRWIKEGATIKGMAQQDAPDAPLLPATPTFLGYIPQRFKVYGQEMTTQAIEYLRQIKNRVYDDISSPLRDHNTKLAPSRSRDPQLGELRDMSSLVLSGQREGVSLWECSDGTPAQRYDAKRAFEEIANQIIAKRAR